MNSVKEKNTQKCVVCVCFFFAAENRGQKKKKGNNKCRGKNK